MCIAEHCPSCRFSLIQYIQYKHAMPARALSSTLAMSIARLIFNTGLGFSDPATVLRVGRHQNMKYWQRWNHM